MAEAFCALLKLLWGNAASVVAPRKFKFVMGQHAPQFVGYAQHDSQELLNFLLDKLHEDLNRVKTKVRGWQDNTGRLKHTDNGEAPYQPGPLQSMPLQSMPLASPALAQLTRLTPATASHVHQEPRVQLTL